MNTILSVAYIYYRIVYAHSMESPSDTDTETQHDHDIPFVLVIIFCSTYIMAFLLYTLSKQTNLKQIISFTLFSLLFTRTSAATLDTTLVGGVSGNGAAGNMFDLCAKTNLEITSLDINCAATGLYTVEIYIATAINEPYAPIFSDSSAWTLIHQQAATCQPVGTLTVLNAFNINTIPALINNGDCRGFYVTLTTDSLKYTNGVSVGSIFASNADLDFKEGAGLEYPFGNTYTPRVWNGRIHYNSGTNAPTLPTTNPTQQPTTSISLCATTPYPTWCYYVDLYPTHSDSTTTVNITDIDRASDVYFNIVFTPRGQLCIDPSITFEYEQIDISATTEYIDIMDNEGSTIQQCQGNGGADSQCNVWWTCVSNYSLGVPQINAEAPYQIQLMASAEMDALCTTLVTNAKLHFQCKGTESPTMEPTFDPSAAPSTQTLAPTTSEPTATPTIANPTNEPTSDPTQIPTLNPSTTNPTQNPSTAPTADSTSDPTQIPSTAPTNIASGNVLSTNITAFQSQNESGKGKGNSNKEFIWIFISVLSVLACINIVCAVFYFNKKRKRLVVKNIANSIIGGETMEDANIENIKGGNECGIELEAVHSENGPEISDDSGEDLYSHNYKATVKDKTEGVNSVVTDEGMV